MARPLFSVFICGGGKKGLVWFTHASRLRHARLSDKAPARKIGSGHARLIPLRGSNLPVLTNFLSFFIRIDMVKCIGNQCNRISNQTLRSHNTIKNSTLYYAVSRIIIDICVINDGTCNMKFFHSSR